MECLLYVSLLFLPTDQGRSRFKNYVDVVFVVKEKGKFTASVAAHAGNQSGDAVSDLVAVYSLFSLCARACACVCVCVCVCVRACVCVCVCLCTK